MDVILDVAIDRAVSGQEYPIVYRGEVVGKVHRYDNALLQRVLRHQDRAMGDPSLPACPARARRS